MPRGPELRFACQPGCTACCEHPGFIYLAEEDIPRIAAYLSLTPVAFEKQYVYRTRNILRLRNARHARCHFLDATGCRIHAVKPIQCRAFPFWPELIESVREWRKTASYCPGIGQGDLIQIESARAIASEVRTAHATFYEDR